ncbi:MAG: UTP--glucose-1-phosphate uridylyltransferase [Pseudomonadota bacterium]
MSHRPVRKAVFPVAGLGTRFLPATKVMPKEMLPLVDRPLIQRAMEEAQEAGIEEFIFVTGRGKSLLTEHFELQPELMQALADKNKHDLIEKVSHSDIESGQLLTALQQVPKGLGHAVWCARKLVGNEPFALLLVDVMILGNPGGVKEMIDVYNHTGGNIIAAAHVDPAETHKYGILDVDDATAKTSPIRAMVEKPPAGTAPSTLHILGRYILQPEIFSILEHQKAGSGGEIQLTDAMCQLMQKQDFNAVQLAGRYYDCGQHLGFIEATVAFALQDPEFGPQVRDMLKTYLT